MPKVPTKEELLKVADHSWRWFPHSYAYQVSRGTWKPYAHLRFISNIIEPAIRAGGARIIVSMHPRSGKSEFISHYVPAWFLDLKPDKKVILASYGADFAASWGAKVRDTLETSNLATTKLRRPGQASDEWYTNEGGGMFTCGVGSGVSGRGGHLLLIDDPIKDYEEAVSETIQKRNIEWFKSTFYTRCEPGASILILTTRWHDNDPAGWLLREHKDQWRYIMLKAIAELNDPMGREPGQALCPERFDENALGEIRKAIGPYHWAAEYQQEPVDIATAMFKRHWIQYFDTWKLQPYRSYVTVDQASSMRRQADYTVIMHTKVDMHKNLYVADYVRAHLSISDCIGAIFEIAERTPTLSAVGIEIQPNESESNSSMALMIREEMRKRGKFFNLKLLRPARDKITRASVLVPLFSNGQVFIRSTMTELEHELLRFPSGQHDDLVDALAYVPYIWQQAQHRRVPESELGVVSIGW